MKILIAGAGGFIGGYLAQRLNKDGHEVTCVDIKPLNEWYQLCDSNKNFSSDLKNSEFCEKFTFGKDYVFNLACNMGGMGFIENNKAECMLSVLINTNLLNYSKNNKVKKFFFSSSACIYPAYKQKDYNNPFLKEEDAYPADSEDGYGWEKLFSERMCRHFLEDFNLKTYVARYHNVYGPYGTWDGGREKAPAALCRKFVEAKFNKTNEIEIWGDGNQLRSFMYIDDCIYGTLKLFNSDYHSPINIGSDEFVSINKMCDILEIISDTKPKRFYKLDAPQGVKSRCSENSLILKTLNWKPSIKLVDGLSKTYLWIENEYKNRIK